jgi:hypothetical protein
MPTSPPLRRTNAAHTAQATSLNFALMTAVDAVDQTGKRVESNTVTTLGLTVGVSGWAGCRIHTLGATRLPKRLRQICFAVITHDV